MRTLFPRLLILVSFASSCVCGILGRLDDDCFRIAWNQSCPETHCTYYFRDPGPYLTCCVCGPARVQIGFYYGVLLLVAAVLLVYEMCRPPSLPLLAVACVAGRWEEMEGDDQDKDEQCEKRAVLQV